MRVDESLFLGVLDYYQSALPSSSDGGLTYSVKLHDL